MTILDKAIVFATNAHSGALRKDGKTPYIVHPMEVAAIAARMTDDIEVIAAAVLHDVVEDTPTTVEELGKEFGKRVADLVMADSEDKREWLPPKATWKLRKSEFLENLPNASREEQIIILADKISNLRSICHEYTEIGNGVWKRFYASNQSEQHWYYDGIAKRLDKVKDTDAFQEYLGLLFEVFGFDDLEF